MARFRWFIAGAAAATGALVSAPAAYQRLRDTLSSRAPAQLPPGAWPDSEHDSAATAAVHPEPEAAAVVPEPATGTPPAGAEDEATRELRLRIEETRARIQKRAHEVPAPGADA
jgi:uncharacterized protein involved in copper resistance